MMADYIRREDARRMVVQLDKYAWKSPVSDERRVTVDVDLVKFGLDRIPAADVAPVVHGQWLSKNPHGYEWTFVCSNCDYVDGYPFNDRHNYCPNCGAKMDGGNDDAVD